MGAGAGSDLDELEELAERINKTARTPATSVRGDPLLDWVQPFEENLAKNVGDEQKKREQQAAAPFAPASVAGAPTTPDDDDELLVDEEIIKEHDPDEQHGDRKIIKVHDPKLPTEERVRQHLLGHLPYRSWCHHCIRGRGRERDHRRQLEDHVEGIPEYHLDYCFPGDELGQRLTILVAVERCSRMKMAVVVPSKGSTGMYFARMVMELISECGDKDSDVIVKTDQEPAIKFLVVDVCVARTGAQTIRELAAKNSKGSNFIVERAVQSVEQLVRTLKSALDERMAVKIDTLHPVLTWLCEYASLLLNRLEVSSDGKTSYERVKGKPAQVIGVEFGEKVLWKFPVHGLDQKMQKINARWGYGFFLGVRSTSGELIVADQETKSIKYTRKVRRVPLKERWSSDNLQWVATVPWIKGIGDKEGDMPEIDVKAGLGRNLTEEEKADIMSREAPRIVHRAHLRSEKHGFTDRCPSCSAILRGLNTQPHSEQCRGRMEKLLEKDIRIMNAKVRLEERLRRHRESDGDEAAGREAKRLRLEEIENQAMNEENLDKLTKLFEDYRSESIRGRLGHPDGEGDT